MTMIERVARAIFRRRFTGLRESTARALFGRVLTYDELVELTEAGLIMLMVFDDLLAEAQEYIAAMREPTREMQIAWAKVAVKGDKVDEPWNDWWVAMIDAALAEKPDEHRPPRA